MSSPSVLPIVATWDGTPAAPGEHATVALSLTAEGLRVSVDAPHHHDPRPAAAPGPTWALWEHEVVELFVLGAEEAYTELELGPHGHHLLLRLAGRRIVVDRLLPVEATWTDAGERWRVEAILPHALLPPTPWRLNAYAIHGVGASRRYLAWTPVPGAEPDFHRLSCFREVPGLSTD
ncbi:MAG: hypothetical protein Q8P41_24765 [Pseudomonadota bacterium]|nr:hypothetical protein [Pseudomonadota bacterium]